MYAKTSVAVLLSIAAATSAQTTAAPKPSGPEPTGPIVSFLIPGGSHFPGGEKMPLVGSIVDVKASQTTMAIQCTPGSDGTNCDLDGEVTVTRGPSTAIMSTMFPAFGDGDDDEEGIMVGYAWDCSIGESATAECVYKTYVTATGKVDPEVMSSLENEVIATASTTHLDQKEVSTAMIPVTITAGAEKLAKSEATAASADVSNASSTSGEAKNTSAAGDAKDSASPTGDAAKASSTPGAAVNVKVGGAGIAGALVALFML